jgi:hypothetical protein
MLNIFGASMSIGSNKDVLKILVKFTTNWKRCGHSVVVDDDWSLSIEKPLCCEKKNVINNFETYQTKAAFSVGLVDEKYIFNQLILSSFLARLLLLLLLLKLVMRLFSGFGLQFLFQILS